MNSVTAINSLLQIQKNSIANFKTHVFKFISAYNWLSRLYCLTWDGNDIGIFEGILKLEYWSADFDERSRDSDHFPSHFEINVAQKFLNYQVFFELL